MKYRTRYIQLEDYLTERETLLPEAQPLFDMLYLTGARVSEALLMKKTDISKDWQSTTLNTLKNRNDPKRSTKLIPHHQTLITSVQEYSQKKNPWDNLFQFQHRKKPRTYVWELARKHFGCTVHSFRHTHATILVRDFNANIYELMQEMGWSDPKPAMIYVKYAFSESFDKKIQEIYSKEKKGWF